MFSAISDQATRSKAASTLRGHRRPWGWTPFFGPALIAAVAYVDPGNFATNIEAGSRYGYALLWVVLSANLMAMLIQTSEGIEHHCSAETVKAMRQFLGRTE